MKNTELRESQDKNSKVWINYISNPAGTQTPLNLFIYTL